MIVNQILNGSRPDNSGICMLVRQTSTFPIVDSDNNLHHYGAFEKYGFQDTMIDCIPLIICDRGRRTRTTIGLRRRNCLKVTSMPT